MSRSVIADTSSGEQTRDNALASVAQKASNAYKVKLLKSILHHAKTGKEFGCNLVRLQCGEPSEGCSANVLGWAFAQMVRIGVIHRYSWETSCFKQTHARKNPTYLG